MKPGRLIALGIGLVVVAAVGWRATRMLFLDEYRGITKEIGQYESNAASFLAGAKGSRDTKIGLRDAADTMLGSDQAVVEHRLRGMLSELAERHSLADIAVTHSRPRPAANPADDRASKVNRSLRRRLGDQTDFAVIRGRLQGTGSLERVVETLADLRAQPWVHRLDGFTIAPANRDRTIFELKADYATMFAPDLVDPDRGPPAIGSPVEADLDALAVLVERAPFRYAEPPAVIVEKPTPPPVAKPGPAPPPYDKWRVTGILEPLEEGGVQVLLARTDSGETRTLEIGQIVLGATLTGAAGEQAWFTKDGAAVVVLAGQTLDQAVAAESVHSQSASQG